jgi:DNA helicase HerA-like ATPase
LIWADGSWCLYIDEAYHIKELGLEPLLIKFLTQGRSKKISVVVGTQRPAWISKFAFSEPTHVFCGRLTLGADLKKIQDEFGLPFRKAVEGLERYQFAYLDQDSDKIQIGREEDLFGILHAEPAVQAGRGTK